MHCRGSILIGLCSAWLVSGSAQALSVVEAVRTTSITVTQSGGPAQHYSESDPVGYGTWTSDLSRRGSGNPVRAYQDSLISDSELSGTGDVAMWTTGDYAESHYRIVFDLSDSTGYNFFVDNMDTNACCTSAPSGLVTLDRVDPVTHDTLQTIYSVTLGRQTGFQSGGQGYPDFSAQGVLGIGTYALDYALHVNGSRNAAGSGLSGFDLAFVPEPTTGLLLLMGIAGLAGARPRRR